MKTAIAYYSKKGFVEEASRKLAEYLGDSASLWDLHSRKGTDLGEADVIVLASSVHAGHFFREIQENLPEVDPSVGGQESCSSCGRSG